MEDGQQLIDQYDGGSLMQNKNCISFHQSRFGPWGTGRVSIISRRYQSPNPGNKLRKIVTQPKIRANIGIRPTKKQSLQPLKLAQNELQISILLNQAKLPTIRVANKSPDPKNQISSFCLPVSNYLKPNSLPYMRNFVSLRPEQAKKSIMKQLNFIRSNKTNNRSKKERVSLNQYSRSPAKYNRSSVKLNAISLDEIEVIL